MIHNLATFIRYFAILGFIGGMGLSLIFQNTIYSISY